MSKATTFRKIRDGMSAAVAALGATSLIAGFMVLGAAGAAQANGHGGQQGDSNVQVWVCKYVGQPGNERLREENNPMQEAAPSSSTTDGWYKKDQQSSYVIGPVTQANTNPGPPESYFRGLADCPGSPPSLVEVTAVAPTVTQSSQCGVQGSYTIHSTTGVQYLLGGNPIAAGTYSGPATGTVTAEALEGYQLTDPEFSSAFDIAAAKTCDEPEGATAVAPSVTQPPACEVEGSYTIPSTAGVQYLLGGNPIAAGTYSGPATGTVTAVALAGFELTNPDFTYALSVLKAAECDDTTPPTDPPKSPPVVPSPPPVSPPVVTPPVVTPPTTDVCANIPGKQGSVPLGYTAVDGVCTKDGVAGEETEAPGPTKTDGPKGQKPTAQPDEVLGEEAVPTAVAAGIGGPTGALGSTSSVLGQGLVAGGLMMLLLAGSAQMGRRQRGAHER